MRIIAPAESVPNDHESLALKQSIPQADVLGIGQNVALFGTRQLESKCPFHKPLRRRHSTAILELPTQEVPPKRRAGEPCWGVPMQEDHFMAPPSAVPTSQPVVVCCGDHGRGKVVENIVLRNVSPVCGQHATRKVYDPHRAFRNEHLSLRGNICREVESILRIPEYGPHEFRIPSNLHTENPRLGLGGGVFSDAPTIPSGQLQDTLGLLCGIWKQSGRSACSKEKYRARTLHAA
jgi:hypothetical protein